MSLKGRRMNLISYEKIIDSALQEGALLDALLALQKAEGYVSEAALSALAVRAGVSTAALFDASSFWITMAMTLPASALSSSDAASSLESRSP